MYANSLCAVRDKTSTERDWQLLSLNRDKSIKAYMFVLLYDIGFYLCTVEIWMKAIILSAERIKPSKQKHIHFFLSLRWNLNFLKWMKTQFAWILLVSSAKSIDAIKTSPKWIFKTQTELIQINLWYFNKMTYILKVFLWWKRFDDWGNCVTSRLRWEKKTNLLHFFI